MSHKSISFTAKSALKVPCSREDHLEVPFLGEIAPTSKLWVLGMGDVHSLLMSTRNELYFNKRIRNNKTVESDLYKHNTKS